MMPGVCDIKGHRCHHPIACESGGCVNKRYTQPIASNQPPLSTAPMSEMTSGLVERIEAATGPDRKLDAEIEIVVAGFPERAYQQKNGMRAKGTPPLDRMEWLQSWGVLSFTASIDAAMTLVPDGAWIIVKNVMGPSPMTRDMFVADVLPEGGKDRPLACRDVPCATAALALCAAALRTRAPLPAPPAKDTIV